MKRQIILLAFLLFTSIKILCQTCNDSTIIQVNGKWKQHPDQLMRPDPELSKIKATQNELGKLFMKAYSQPKGMEAIWYRTMSDNLVVKNGPTPYTLNTLYQAYYCNTSLNKMMLGEETGTWAYTFVNTFSWFMNNQYDKLNFTVGNNYAYILASVVGKWKGYTLYQASPHGKLGRCIMLTHGNKLPWKLVTQQQYLQGVRGQWVKGKNETLQGFVKREEEYTKTVAQMKANTYLKPADKEKILADLEKSHNDMLKNKDADIAKSNKYWDENIAVIDQYIARTDPATLQQPAIVDHTVMGEFKGSFSTLEKGGQAVVIVNTDYFDFQLPKYVPQMIVLYWRWDLNAPGRNFKKEFEENFPVEELQGMIR